MNPADPFGLIGQVLDGQFRVDKFVGEGGFSIVYRGHHAGLNEPIAVKCLKLPPALGSALVESFIRRFRDESRIHYRLSQGNLAIARSIASGTTMSPSTSALVPYMVLEWLDGRSLAQDFDVRRQNGAHGRTLEEAVKLLDTAAQGLAFAHAQGVVHRDMNPGNLFLAERQQSPNGIMTKVLDFGVAKVISDHALEMGPRAQTLGQIRIFAPAYGSPEQFDDSVGKVGPQSDVYSFAIIVLEALRDLPVRDGEHLGEFALLALDPAARPTPRSLGVPVGDAVEEVFKRAVAIRPEERPMDMGQFWGGLKHAMRADAESGKPPHADAVLSRPGSAWKPQPPAAGQAPPDRTIAADMLSPVVEVSRPGSTAPPPDPGQSQALRGTVRIPGGATPRPPGAGGPSPMTSTLVMDSRPRIPVSGSAPVSPVSQAAAKPNLNATVALNSTVAMNSPFAGQDLSKLVPAKPSPNATMVLGAGAAPTFEAARTMAAGGAMAPTNEAFAARARDGYGPGNAPPPMRAEVATVVPPQPSARGKIIAIAIVILLLLGIGGFAGYRAMVGGTQPSASASASAGAKTTPPVAPTAPSAATVSAVTAPAPTVPPPPPAADTAPPPAETAAAETTEPPPRAEPTGRHGAHGSGGAAAGPAQGPTPRAPAPTSVPAAAASGPKGFDASAARASLDIMNGVLASCRSSGGKTGDGTINVTFGSDGHVARAAVDEPPFAGTPEASCVTSRFQQAKMAPFDGPPGTVAYTFHIPN